MLGCVMEHGTPHCYVQRDFVDTYDGITPCQVVPCTTITIGLNETTIDS